MLSSENPPPSTHDSDPPTSTCGTPLPCEEISQLIKSDRDHERASSDDKVPFQEEVDLFKSGLDYDNNPLPKFAIRDYVFSTRSKDINTNWPFSQKNLQLCLKHGVKDLLPPFQSLESIRNRSIERTTVETSLVNNQNIIDLDGKPSISPCMASDHFVSAASANPGSCTQNLAFHSVDIDLEESKQEKKRDISEVQVTAVGQSHSEIDPADKSKSKNQSPVKKCRLIVKVGSADPGLNEDHIHMSKGVAVSETMASNVCPVCKTFSSSSNTTLNAHIDQCLSPDSYMTWTPSSRVVRHRIKPKRIRLMTDIYATARHCTLEELDRRNGTNWASNTSFPAQENLEDCVEEEEEEEEERRVTSVDLKEKGDEGGAVYIDGNGTKVRILSKFIIDASSSSLPKREADIGTRKILKGGKGSKLNFSFKKKYHAKKHRKYLELALQSKQFCSSKPRRANEVHRDGGRNFSMEENCGKVGSLPQPFKAQELIKANGSGTMMKWACSKRTVLYKKRNPKEGLHDVGRNFRLEYPAESTDQPSLGDSYVGRSCALQTPSTYESPLASPENRKRLRNSLFKTPLKECDEEPSMAKKVGFNKFESQKSVKQVRMDSTSANVSCKDFEDNGEQYVPYLGKQSVEKNVNLHSNSSRSHHAFASKAPKFSSLKKHVLAADQSVVTKSKCRMKMKFASNNKSAMHFVAESSEEVVEKHDSKKKQSENPIRIHGNDSLGRSGVLKLKKKRGAFGISQNEDYRPLKSSAECLSHEVGRNTDSSSRVCGDIPNTFGDRVISPPLGVDNAMSLSRSLSPEFHNLGSPRLGDEQEMFCVDKAVNNLIAENTDVGDGGMGSKDGQGNYFSEVDPIPIPGPPGSFLPSPRDMGSEDLQGNSSITTSRVHSSEDDHHHDLVDRDSSDSPISATSSVSNSMMARSDSKSSERMFTQDEIQLGIPIARSYDATAQNNNTPPASQAATLLSERANLSSKGFTSFRNDQPCCCSRKEGMSQAQGVSLNYQESQLLRRRTNSLNSMPEMIPMESFPGMKSAVGPVSMKVSTDSALNSPAFGDYESASPSPSASNSMIRLMGRNLMVVNKDENVSQQFKPVVPQSISPHPYPNPHFQKLSGFFSGNTQSEDFPSFYRVVHQQPNMGFGSYATSKSPQASPSPHASSSVLFSKNVGGIGYNCPSDQFRSWKRTADSTGNSMKEVIVVDDTPPTRKANSANDVAPFSENIMENRVSSAGIPVLTAANCNSRYLNPFYSYQLQDYSNSESKPHRTQSASFQIPPHGRAGTSSSNLRSSSYYPPSFS